MIKSVDKAKVNPESDSAYNTKNDMSKSNLLQ